MSAATAANPRAGKSPAITDHELSERLEWFTQVRWVFGLGSLLVLLVAWHVFDVRLHMDGESPSMAPAVIVVLTIFLYNAGFVFSLRALGDRGALRHRAIVNLALAQILCDVVAICALIHYTGGVRNSFVVLLLLPIVIVTELLPQSLAYLTAAGAAAVLNALAWAEQQGWIPYVWIGRAGEPPPPAEALHTEWLHVLHVTAAMTLAIFAMVFVASTIATRLRRREAELEEAHQQLHEIDEAKSFFLRRVEHEMRAPLTAVHSILDAVALQDGSLAGDTRHLVERAKGRTRALIDLVSDLRRFSHLQQPDALPATETVPLDRVVTKTVDLLAPSAAQKNVELSCDTRPIETRGQAELLEELVTNLVSNAIQYTPPGGRVEVTLQSTGPTAELKVSDTGIGIPASFTDRIFEEFYRTPEARKTFRDGTGLGLAIVRRIVQLHQGHITIESEPNLGSTFTVSFPVAANPPHQGLRRVIQ